MTHGGAHSPLNMEGLLGEGWDTLGHITTSTILLLLFASFCLAFGLYFKCLIFVCFLFVVVVLEGCKGSGQM